MSRRASLKTLTIPLLAAGAAIAVIGFVAGRREVPPHRASYIGKLAPKKDATRARGAESLEKAVGSRARRPVLPIAFWDVTELDRDEQRPASSSEGYATMEDSDDASGARWLARATQSADADDELEARDDPAEVAADSMSMISEASRAAAGGEPSDDDELEERV